MASSALQHLLRTLRRWLDHGLLTADVGSAFRSAAAMAITWAACIASGHPEAAVIAATTAQNVALLHVRGDYAARVVILLLLIALIGAWVLVGTVAGSHVWTASLLTLLLALSAGGWRHASGDYGPHFALAPALLFFLAISHPGDWHLGARQLAVALAGGAIGLLTQITGWCVRPQHALRHASAEAWVASADLFASMEGSTTTDPASTGVLPERENTLRATIDRSLRAIQTSSQSHPELGPHLDELTQLAARLATRVLAFHTAVEPLRMRTSHPPIEPVLRALWESIEEATRSTALTIITHRQSQFVALDVRLRCVHDHARVVDARLGELGGSELAVARSRELLAHVVALLPDLRAAVGRTIDHGVADAGGALRLPALRGRSLRTLGAWINPPAQIDSVLVRYSLRIGLLMTAAVAAYKGFDIPRGYWIAFTVLVVLQPDYGATRQRAVQRIVGTLAGGLLGSLLLWIRMPIMFHLAASSLLAFGFAYYLRRNYTLAVFYVTLMLVLMIEAMMPVHLDFTIARMSATLTGGALALLAALLLWPKWELERAPAILAAALRANRRYLEVVGGKVSAGEPFTGSAVQAKREAERANSRAAASLQRRFGEPARERGNIDRAATVTAYNRRLTRAITLLGMQTRSGAPALEIPLSTTLNPLLHALDLLADAAGQDQPIPTTSRMEVESPLTPGRDALILDQVAAIAREIDLMAESLRSTSTAA